MLCRDKSTNQPVLKSDIISINTKKKEEEVKSRRPAKESKQKSIKNDEDNLSSEQSKKQENPINNIRSLVGYMPKRGDFDTEYDDEAETRI